MNGIFGVISAKFCIFDIASFFAIPPNSASYGLLEEFLFIFQRYEISITLTISPLEKYQHFTTGPNLFGRMYPEHRWFGTSRSVVAACCGCGLCYGIGSGIAEVLAFLHPDVVGIYHCLPCDRSALLRMVHSGDYRSLPGTCPCFRDCCRAVLGMARIPYAKWVRWVWKFILALIVVGFLLLLPTVFLPLEGF